MCLYLKKLTQTVVEIFCDVISRRRRDYSGEFDDGGEVQSVAASVISKKG